MPETVHKNFFLTRKALALLPLLLLGVAAWYLFLRSPGSGAQREVLPADPFKRGEPQQVVPPSSAEEPAAARIPEAYDPKAGLEMLGPENFKAQVTHALKLIWTADRESFLFIRRNLDVIRNENRTGFYLENGRYIASLSDSHAFRSVTWCAGIIAHQAWHAAYEKARNRRKGKFTPPPPGEKAELRVEANPMKIDYKGVDAILYVEGKAFDFQYKVLRGIGAPSREKNLIFRRAPRDFHLAHDGNYSFNP